MQKDGPLATCRKWIIWHLPIRDLWRVYKKGQLGQIADTTEPTISQVFPGPNLTHEKPQVPQWFERFGGNFSVGNSNPIRVHWQPFFLIYKWGHVLCLRLQFFDMMNSYRIIKGVFTVGDIKNNEFLKMVLTKTIFQIWVLISHKMGRIGKRIWGPTYNTHIWNIVLVNTILRNSLFFISRMVKIPI